MTSFPSRSLSSSRIDRLIQANLAVPINFYKASDKEIREIRSKVEGEASVNEERERERKLVHRARPDILSRFRIVRYYRMRAPELRCLRCCIRRCAISLRPSEYCDFLRKLKSRGLYHSNDRPRHIVRPAPRCLHEACFVTTSHGYHSHQIETGLCIRLTLCPATLSCTLDGPSRRICPLPCSSVSCIIS